jgi:1,4-alpha-glucan branching enzyme
MLLPGKKLFFMGSETGSTIDWVRLIGQQQGMLDDEISERGQQLQHTIKALTDFYKANPGLWRKDDNAGDLKWIEKHDPNGSFVGYRRDLDKKHSVACFHNFSATSPKKYVVSAYKGKEVTELSEIFNSNAEQFGGNGTHQNVRIETELDANGKIKNYTILIPPLSAVVIKESYK